MKKITTLGYALSVLFLIVAFSCSNNSHSTESKADLEDTFELTEDSNVDGQKDDGKDESQDDDPGEEDNNDDGEGEEEEEENNQQAETGIEGTVLMGPMCPVVTYPSSCPDQPFSALFHVFNEEGNDVSKFQSDEQGHFRVELSPGEYNIIVDESVAFLQRRQSKKVIVNEKEFTSVTLLFDTGIR